MLKIYVFSIVFLISCLEKKSSKEQAFPCFFSLSSEMVVSGESILVSSSLEKPWESLKSIHVLGEVLTEEKPTHQFTLGATTSIRATATRKDGSLQYCDQTLVVKGEKSGIACSLSVNPPFINDNVKTVNATLSVSGENLSQVQATFIGEKNLESIAGGSLDLTLESAELVVGSVQLKEETVFCDFQVRNQSYLCPTEASESQTKELASINEGYDQEFEAQMKTFVSTQFGDSFERVQVLRKSFSSVYDSDKDVCHFFSIDCLISQSHKLEDHNNIQETGVFKLGSQLYGYIISRGVRLDIFKNETSYQPVIYQEKVSPSYLDIDLCACEQRDVNDGIASDISYPMDVTIHYFEVINEHDVFDHTSLEVEIRDRKYAYFRKNIIPPGIGQTKPVCPRDWARQT